MFKKLTAHRNLLKNLVIRDLKYRYAGSIGGFLWSVIHPLALLLSYTFIFKVVLKQKNSVADYGTDNFAIFFFCGFLPWLMFSDTITRSCNSIVDQKNLVTKTVIPAEILPISITLSTLINHLIGLTILLTALATFFTLPASALYILIYMPMLVMFSLGIGWIVAALQVFLRDTVQALQVLIMLWFWFTPIFYPVAVLHSAKARMLLSLNPMAAIVTGYRNALLNLQPPDINSVLTILAVSSAVFVAGALLFRQAKPAFPDVL